MVAKAEREGLARFLAERWEQVSRKIAELAEEVPAEKFESTPVASARSVGQVLRHVAFWNQYVADSLRGKSANDTANELSLAEYPTKASVLEVLRRSANEVAEAVRNSESATNLKTAELVVPFVEHTAEHYGQLVAYCRLMSILPPASR
ncbi:MAG TPA: DinB family protein [Bryobacteraceae bacterium]|nr:DinB family protein [Bryobacteraceae bacterium]